MLVVLEQATAAINVDNVEEDLGCHFIDTKEIVDLANYFEGAQGEVLDVADGSGDDVEGALVEDCWF